MNKYSLGTAEERERERKKENRGTKGMERSLVTGAADVLH